MATAPYEIDATLPQNSNQVAQYPGQSQTFRDIIKSWLEQLSDKTTGLLKRSALPASERTPYGGVMHFAGTTAPTGWLFAYGQAVSRTTYANLFAVTSTTYGAGDGSTTFNLPDLRGRVIAGQDDMGGTSANRLTAQSGGVNGDTLGAAGGSETHTLTTAQLSAHTHTVSGTAASSGAHTHSYITAVNKSGSGSNGPDLTSPWWGGGVGEATGSNGAHTHTVSGTAASTGGGDAHNNVQPTFILNTIIFTGVE